MLDRIENIITRVWNRWLTRRVEPVRDETALDFGVQIIDGEPTRHRITLKQSRRAEHVAILGKTGSGKSFLIRSIAQSDVAAGRGFLLNDFHSDNAAFMVKVIAARERILKRDLSDRLIVIDLADPEFSTALNVLEERSTEDRFVHIAEITEILKNHWHLDSFGARTDELLRFSLYVLAENRLTLIELALLLSDAEFRSRCLEKVTNSEVKQYFELRFGQASNAMQNVMREPILNKVSAFVSDPRFRHIIGQACSAFSLAEAMDRGYWIILNLDKGRLGEQAITLASLFLAKIKHALFARRNRQLFIVYADEIQNLAAFGGGIETILAEARKFSVGVVSANQYLDQYPSDMRAAILAVGTHAFFQLAGPDAHAIATMLDGGKTLAERLKNLPRRHAVIKTVDEPWREGLVPFVREPQIDPTDLYRRVRERWARRRSDIEVEIRERQRLLSGSKRAQLDDWD